MTPSQCLWFVNLIFGSWISKMVHDISKIVQDFKNSSWIFKKLVHGFLKNKSWLFSRFMNFENRSWFWKLCSLFFLKFYSRFFKVLWIFEKLVHDLEINWEVGIFCLFGCLFRARANGSGRDLSYLRNFAEHTAYVWSTRFLFFRMEWSTRWNSGRHLCQPKLICCGRRESDAPQKAAYSSPCDSALRKGTAKMMMGFFISLA
jgi:hypothetical protein